MSRTVSRTRSPRLPELVLRTPTTADDQAIGELFDATLALGEPLGFTLARGDRYRDLCLRWYLDAERAGAVVILDPAGAGADAIIGYALVCTDESAYRKVIRRKVGRFVGGTMFATVTCRLNAPSRRFYADRLRDAVQLARSLERRPSAAHVHLNVRSDHRSGSAALLLLEHVDQYCRGRGVECWSGEINAAVGSRQRALTRLGLDVVARVPNHTLSRQVGRPVERLLIVRDLRPPTPGRSPRPHSTGLPPW